MVEKKYKKEVALKLMRQIGISETNTKSFEQENNIYCYEHFGGFFTCQKEELHEVLNEIEQEFNCVVYAVIHEFYKFDEYYNFLIVTCFEEDYNDLVCKEKDNTYFAKAYVYNVTQESQSGFMNIVIQTLNNNIRRIR